ncbi:hypothetical protein [Demequina lutea]|uniref:Uncharacterized protein n=1 Tax=Demequina lutea TaxID=431489 RepID=A0A7Y9ZE24_9MICO|nr:hypothetical protein [Demequina lutea]NYI42858.1 hypothetical protein [Demequina lutea]
MPKKIDPALRDRAVRRLGPCQCELLDERDGLGRCAVHTCVRPHRGRDTRNVE